MKYYKFGALLYMLLTTHLHASIFSLAPGVSVSSANQSRQLTTEGKSILKQNISLGFNLDAEIRIYKKLSFLLNGQWIGGEGTSQYSFTNKENPLEQASVKDMKSNFSIFSMGLGARLRFLEVKGVIAFIGYLHSKGEMILSHDENKFLYHHYSKLGWKDREEQSFKESTFELGLELFPARSGKLHIIGRMNTFKTKTFETLGDKKLDFKNHQLLILYRHLF
ncbi:MAG TPA: hypothetical protein VKY27_03110 [Bacteriovoracaceae bacterium]|nr:hypothetical protein [Bacteriovoracaceae bacterium]